MPQSKGMRGELVRTIVKEWADAHEAHGPPVAAATVTRLGTLGGPFSLAERINDRG